MTFRRRIEGHSLNSKPACARDCWRCSDLNAVDPYYVEFATFETHTKMLTPVTNPGAPLTREQIKFVIAQMAELSLKHFRDDKGAFSHDSAAKMVRLEASIELERRLMWWVKDDGPKAA